jgi:NitT/TauT family transport system permease protein
MGANRFQTFTKVVLPAASPWIITAMKVSIPFSLIGSIVGEFMASTAGLGFKIQEYTSQFDTTGAVTGILILMVIVVGLNNVLDRIEARVLRWRPSVHSDSSSEAL